MPDNMNAAGAINQKDESVSPLDFEMAADLLRAYISETKRDIVVASIFGSVAKGCNNVGSDIDVLLVSFAPAMTKQNVLFGAQRFQLIDGSTRAIRQRVADVLRSRNDFLISVILDSRWVAGDHQCLVTLKEVAEPIAKAGMPPMHRDHYISIRSRCADAIEKIQSTRDTHHRMFVGQRIYSLLHELAAANNRASLHTGTRSYPQFVELAPSFAVAMASRLRVAIAQDDYDEFIDAVRLFFDKAGGFSWDCETAFPM